MESKEHRYAGFWARFAAGMLDFLIFIPVIKFIGWGYSHYRLFDLYWAFAQIPLTLFLQVYLVARFGGTIGKLIVGLKVTKLNGDRVSYWTAFVRESPNLLMGTLGLLGCALPLLAMTDVQYFALDHSHHYKELKKIAPQWCSWLDVVTAIWVWSELIVLLTNKKKRALHDFLAGTIVIHKIPQKSES